MEAMPLVEVVRAPIRISRKGILAPAILMHSVFMLKAGNDSTETCGVFGAQSSMTKLKSLIDLIYFEGNM
jgi:hypothetical protein